MAQLGADTADARGPLAGIVVVDLTRVLAGPFCTMLLADLGARVIKVENPKGGDDSRAYGPFINGKSGYFIAQNRGKESIALDLKNANDQMILHRLLRRADILIENFRPGTMARLGFGPEELKKRYPQLIFASTSGFGQTGPYADRPAYDIIAQAMGGIMSTLAMKVVNPRVSVRRSAIWALVSLPPSALFRRFIIATVLDKVSP